MGAIEWHQKIFRKVISANNS